MNLSRRAGSGPLFPEDQGLRDGGRSMIQYDDNPGRCGSTRQMIIFSRHRKPLNRILAALRTHAVLARLWRSRKIPHATIRESKAGSCSSDALTLVPCQAEFA